MCAGTTPKSVKLGETAQSREWVVNTGQVIPLLTLHFPHLRPVTTTK